MERLSPSELAKKVQATAITNTRNYRDPGIDKMIGKARQDRVWRFLDTNTFEAGDSGHITFETVDTSDYDDPGRVISAINVRFTDANGYQTRLGGIRGSWMPGPPAEVNVSVNETEPLYPNDERWDAVVGAIGRALLQYDSSVADNR